MRYKSESREQTVEIGKKLAEKLKPGDFIALFGDLGAGKTALTGGIAAGLGYDGEVTSPTFALVHEYSGGRLTLYHFDLYRVTGEDELYSAGFYDYLDAGGVIVTEWSENIKEYLPTDAVFVSLERGDDENTRVITVKGAEYENTGD
ncbi:MAG TPA: tRNA (adenosine(37)-N6)-threonylcarbamoyltransferase complex ATPase subunit type 1 TsaE [Ruminococcaceae bacterium]|nr:tRNA (adenosine(37)-N6)-threonylcarbamoyltransferase complex ATPase subunit type 1 TsaE [Oscillospiraceae bacterium]